MIPSAGVLVLEHWPLSKIVIFLWKNLLYSQEKAPVLVCYIFFLFFFSNSKTWGTLIATLPPLVMVQILCSWKQLIIKVERRRSRYFQGAISIFFNIKDIYTLISWLRGEQANCCTEVRGEHLGNCCPRPKAEGKSFPELLPLLGTTD